MIQYAAMKPQAPILIVSLLCSAALVAQGDTPATVTPEWVRAEIARQVAAATNALYQTINLRENRQPQPGHDRQLDDSRKERDAQREALLQIQKELRRQREERQKQRERYERSLLEPPLPLAQAVEKSKKKDPQGYYALAIIYAKGEEVTQDDETAHDWLDKAAAADYGNAVFVKAMFTEFTMSGRDNQNRVNEYSLLQSYTGVFWPRFARAQNKLSFLNDADVDKVKAEYERAIKLGVTAAKDELARFSGEVDEARKRAKNAASVQSAFQAP